MYGIEFNERLGHLTQANGVCRVQTAKLILEIEHLLSGSSEVKCEPRSMEPRSRWLKYADLALKKEGRKPNHDDVTHGSPSRRTAGHQEAYPRRS
jgi:hypothetical protein